MRPEIPCLNPVSIRIPHRICNAVSLPTATDPPRFSGSSENTICISKEFLQRQWCYPSILRSFEENIIEYGTQRAVELNEEKDMSSIHHKPEMNPDISSALFSTGRVGCSWKKMIRAALTFRGALFQKQEVSEYIPWRKESHNYWYVSSSDVEHASWRTKWPESNLASLHCRANEAELKFCTRYV